MITFTKDLDHINSTKIKESYNKLNLRSVKMYELIFVFVFNLLLIILKYIRNSYMKYYNTFLAS